MILHVLVDIEIGAGYGVKACQQFIHHNNQAHVGRFFDKELFGPLLVDFRRSLARTGFHMLQQSDICLVNELAGGFGVFSHIFGRIARLEIIVLAGIPDTGGHQYGISPSAAQDGFGFKVKTDFPHNLFHA